MANTFKVIDMITKESTRILHEKLAFIGTVDRQYDDAFSVRGAKIGDTLRVRRPNQYTVRTGQKMNVQDQDETYDSITRATMKGVDMKFNHKELIDSVNSDGAFDDFSKNYIEPAVNVLASTIEAEFLEYATKATYNLVGTAGNSITTILVPGLARARLNQCLAPTGGQRYVQFDSVAMAYLVNGAQAYFNPQAAIGQQYKEGFVSRTAMADWFENERVWTMVNGDDVAGAVDESAETNFVQGADTIHMDALGTTVYAGQVFTWDGIYACHPETKQKYPYLQQFVVTSTPTIAGNEGDITFSPAIYTTGPKKNVCTSTGAEVTWTSAAQNNAVITFVGAVSSSYQQPLMYHKEAFQFVTADLPMMDDAHKCMVKKKDGLSLRVWQGSDIVNGELLMRLDILYGMAALNPNFACRMIGAANV